ILLHLGAAAAPGSAAQPGWSLQSVPIPAGAGSSILSSESCASATACTAVGGYVTGNGFSTVQYTLAERWNGSTWSFQTMPNPVGAVNSYLNAVSCPSATFASPSEQRPPRAAGCIR